MKGKMSKRKKNVDKINDSWFGQWEEELTYDH